MLCSRLSFIAVAGSCILACTPKSPDSAADESPSDSTSASTAHEGSDLASDEGSVSGGFEDDTATPDASADAEADSDAADTQASDGGEHSEDPRFDLGIVPDSPPQDDEGCELDFLFVIDNSDSMKDEQDNLARSVPEFVKAVRQRVGNHEFHLGVVTTDAYMANAPGCTGIGSLVTQTEGLDSSNSVCGPYAEGKTFMTDADDLETSFPCAAKPGTWGDISERQSLAMRRAISADLLGPGGCNEDFVRDDALLVVTLITDEDDRTGLGTPDEWYRELVAAKGGEGRIVLLSLIGLPEPNNCPEWPVQAVEGVNLGELTRRFGDNGHLGDICLENYGEFFESAIDVIDTACTQLPEGR